MGGRVEETMVAYAPFGLLRMIRTFKSIEKVWNGKTK